MESRRVFFVAQMGWKVTLSLLLMPLLVAGVDNYFMRLIFFHLKHISWSLKQAEFCCRKGKKTPAFFGLLSGTSCRHEKPNWHFPKRKKSWRIDLMMAKGKSEYPCFCKNPPFCQQFLALIFWNRGEEGKSPSPGGWLHRFKVCM